MAAQSPIHQFYNPLCLLSSDLCLLSSVLCPLPSTTVEYLSASGGTLYKSPLFMQNKANFPDALNERKFNINKGL